MSEIAVKLPAALERFVADQVRDGAYPSAAAAIVAAVDRERRRTKQRAWLSTELDRGLASPSAGEYRMADVLRRGRARRASSSSPPPAKRRKGPSRPA